MISRKWQLWVGIAISVGLLAILLYQVNPRELKDALAGANYIYLAPAVAVYFVSVFFRSVRWRYLLMPLRPFPVKSLYPVVVVGYTANNLLPMRLGELVRAYYLARRENFSTSSALGTVAVERVFDGVTLLAAVAVTAPVLLLLGEFDDSSNISRGTIILLAAVTVAVFGGALLLFTALAVSPRFAAMVEGRLNILPQRLREPVQCFYRSFLSALGILSSPRKHFELIMLSLPVWAGEWAVYFLIAFSFDLHTYFGSVGVLVLAVALLTATSNLATGVPSAVGGIGPFEVVAQQTLVLLGVGATVAGTYAGFVHLVALWLPVNLVGLVILWKQNLSLKQVMGAPEEPALEAALVDGPVADPLGLYESNAPSAGGQP